MVGKQAEPAPNNFPMVGKNGGDPVSIEIFIRVNSCGFVVRKTCPESSHNFTVYGFVKPVKKIFPQFWHGGLVRGSIPTFKKRIIYEQHPQLPEMRF